MYYKLCFFGPKYLTNSNFTYPGIHEHEIHLAESEHHLENWIDAPQNLITWRSPRNFKKTSKF